MIKATLQMWSAHQVKGRLKDAPGLVGRALLHGPIGSTTAVVAVFPETHCVQTQSGSIYRLGVPNLGFAIHHPEILREVGM